MSVKFGKAKVETTDACAGNVFVCSPERGLAKTLGTVFGIFELRGLPEAFVEAFKEIISDLQTEYYLPPFNVEAGVEKRFEECIQRANRRLHKAVNESIEEVDVSGIAVLAGLSHKNAVHLAHAGPVRALLVHMRKDGQLINMDILGNGEGQRPSQAAEKLFSNISSGQISSRDRIVAATPGTAAYLSGADMINLIENDPESLIDSIRELLEGQGARDNYYVLTMEPDYDRIDNSPATPTQQSATPRPASAPEHSINNLLHTQRNTEKYLAPSVMPSWKKALLLIGAGMAKAAAWLAPKLKKLLILFGKQLWRLGKSLYRSLFQRRQAAKPITASPAANTTITTDAITSESIISTDSASVKETTDYEPPKAVPDPFPSFGKSKGLQGMFSDWLNLQLAKIARLKRKQKLVLLAAFLLIFTFSESVVLIGQGSEPKPLQQNQAIANQIEEKINLAEAQNIFNDTDGARALLAEAQEMLSTIPDNKRNAQLISNLKSKFDSVRMAVEKLSSIENPQLLFDLSEMAGTSPVSTLALSGQDLLASVASDGRLYKIDLKNKEVSVGSAETGTNISDTVAAANSELLLLDREKGVFNYNLKSDSAANAIAAAGIKDIGYYSNNAYLLDSGRSQILKYQISGGRTSGGSAILKDAALGQAQAFAVNGDFFVLGSDGKIRHYSRGAIQDTAYDTLSQAIGEAELYAGGNDYLYVLDKTNNRLVIYGGNGDLKVQITSPKFSSLKSMAVNEKEKTVYLLSDNRIYIISTGL